MIYTTHIITGSAIGLCFDESISAFLAGIISHHLIDWIPHIDPGTFWSKEAWKRPGALVLIAADLIVGTAVFIWLWWYLNFPPPTLWGALGAILPDVVDNNPWSRKIKLLNGYHKIHTRFHNTVAPDRWLLGTLTQVLLIVLSLMIIWY